MKISILSLSFHAEIIHAGPCINRTGTHVILVLYVYMGWFHIHIVWKTNDIRVDFNDIHWEGCLHITRR